MELRSHDDDSFLDEALDRLVEAWTNGSELPVDELIAARPELEAEIHGLLQTTRVTAVQSSHPRKEIAGYELIHQLGRGGMGRVYLARQRRLGRLVALKVLPEFALASPRSCERFRREALALASLRHPNIVSIHDVIETEGVAAYAMEWIDGPTLAEARLEDPSAACRMAIAVLRALAVVHGAGLVHRDVSARNILIRPDGTPVLTDFGLARDLRASGVTQSGEFIGTAAYAAPEQLRGDQEAIGPASDQYAVGILLFEALFGRHPFEGAESATAILRRMEAGVAPQPRRAERALSRDLEVVVGKALAPDPDERYADVDAFADDLLRVLEFRPISARPPSLPRRARYWLRQHRTAVVAALVAASFVAVLAGWFMLDQARRARIPEAVASSLRTARLELLDPEIGPRLFHAHIGEPDAPALPHNLLEPALAHYDRAIALTPNDSLLVCEREVVALAQRIRGARGLEIPATLERSCPLTSAFARDQLPPPRLDGATRGDRRALGLLAYLLGAPEVCIEAWSGLDLSDRPDPLVDAALGDLHLSLGRPALAHPRLLRAAQAFPTSGHLVISAADAACQVGDTEVAARLARRARDHGLDNAYEMLECVEADLVAARGELEKAASLYARSYSLPPGGCVKYARLLRRLGRDEDALRLELGLARKYPGARSFTLSLRQHAAAWWAALEHEERVAVIARAFDRLRPHVLPDLLQDWPDLERRSAIFRESATLGEGNPTPEDQLRLLRGLTLTREILIMNRDADLLLTTGMRSPLARILLHLDHESRSPAARSGLRTLLSTWRAGRALILAMATSLILAQGAQGQSSSYTDDSFLNWGTTVNASTTGASYSSGSVPTGGNPGACWSFTHSLPGGVPYSTMNLIHRPLDPAATFDPVQVGGIATVDLSVEMQTVSVSPGGAFGDVIGVVFGVLQDGVLWAAGGTYQAVFIGGYATLSHTGLSESDFDDGNGAHPNFSSGNPLVFVVLSGNSCNHPGGCGSAQMATGRLDNFAVSVHHVIPSYPGTGDDFVLATGLNGAPCTTGGSENLKTLTGGGFLEVCLSSPNGAFVGAPILLCGQVHQAGTPLTATLPFPFDMFWLTHFVILVDGLTNPYGLNKVVGPNGSSFTFLVIPNLAGQQIALQAGAMLPSAAANGSFALSEAHVITLQ